MTSRSTLGGYEQSTGSHYGHGTQPDLYYPKTFALAAYELAPSACLPPAQKVLPSVARSAQQEDRAPILDRIIAFGIAFIVGSIGACALLVGVGMALFVKF